MKPNTITTRFDVDRLATADEIRAAVLPSPDPIEVCAAQNLCEIASDLGGFIYIPAVEFEISHMVEDLIREQDTRPN
jgi:hypothetical protein